MDEGLPDGIEFLAKRADIILHAGDFVTPEVYEAFAALGSLKAVCGNADLPELRSLLPERTAFDVGGVRIGLVHMASHSFDLTGAGFLAREMDVDVLVFGHIHRPIIEQGRRVLICPGSPTFPRMSAPSVAEIEIDSGKVAGRIVPLGAPMCDYLKFAGSLGEKEEKEG